MLAGTAEAFDIPTGNPDLALRWDNTFRYNLGVRVAVAGPEDPRESELRRRRPQLQQRVDRHQPARPAVRVRRRISSASTASASAPPAGTTTRTATSTTHNNATANTLSTACPAAGVLSPYTKRYAKGLSGEFLDAFAFANVRRRATCRSTSRRASTPSTGARACFSAARSTAFRTRRTRSTCGKASPRRAARRRSCSGHAAASRCRRSRRKDLSLAGQWFYNWQAIRVPESGSYLTVNDALNFGGESLIFGPESVWPRRFPARPRSCACGTRTSRSHRARAAASAISVSRRAGARSGSTARSASTTATRPISRRRLVVTPGVLAHGACCGVLRPSAAFRYGGTNCIINRARHDRRRPPAVRQTRHVSARLRRQHPHLRRQPVQADRRR